MSLLIKYTHHIPKEVHNIPFKPSILSNDIIVASIEADGDELAYILNRFANIPCLQSDYRLLNFGATSKDDVEYIALKRDHTPRGYVMNWYGDIAKFIIGNLV